MAVKTTLVIASRTEQENYILQKKLEVLEYEFKGLAYVSVHPAGLAPTVDRLTAAVLINLTEWSARDVQMITDLRAGGYQGPLLVTAKPDVDGLYLDLRNLSGVAFLEKPFEVKDVVGIVRKMLHARKVAHQVHRRYPTSQDAEVEAGGGKKLMTRVRNLSRGGAYLEFLTPAPVKIGDTVLVKLELNELNRTYTLPAKVVWTSRASGRGAGIGVEFTGRGDVKSAILGY